MPMELAAAAFVRGAARSTAAEPWKATVRTPTHLVLGSPPDRRRLFLSSGSTSAPDAPHRRRNLTMKTYIQEHASGPQGVDYSCTRRRNFLPTNDPRSRPFLAVAPWRHEGGAYSNRSATSLRAGPTFSDYFSLYPVKARLSPSARSTAAGVPNLGKLAKISWLCLMLHNMGHLVPPPKVDKVKALVKFAILSLALLAGYMTSKDHNKLAFMLKVCDSSMKMYKGFAEIVDLLSTFFK